MAELRRRLQEREVQHERRVKALEEALAQQTLERQRLQAELEQFSHVASHDLQEPLRKIQTFGSLLNRARDGLSEAERDYLARMQEAARSMQAMIEGLLAYSRVTTRAESFEPVDLGGVARAVKRDLKMQIEQMGGRLEVGPLPKIEADPTQMYQLLWHLIHNGFKFHRTEEAPVVRVYGQALEDGTEGCPSGGRLCQILVEDNGIGFQEAFVDRLFGIFQRLNGRSEYEGAGMGLAICRKILERHGGRIAARGTRGEGATFMITLPVGKR